PRLLEARALEELGAILRVELGDLRLERGADRDRERALRLGELLERGEVLVGRRVPDRALVDVPDVERRLRREEEQLADDRLGVDVVRPRRVGDERARGLALIEVRGDLLADRRRELLLRVVALRRLARAVEALVHRLEVLQAQL